MHIQHKAIAIPMTETGHFLTVKDKRFQEWLFVTGGCRKREIDEPILCALRELKEETRGVVDIDNCLYKYFSFKCKSLDDPDAMSIYHVFLLRFEVSIFIRNNLIRKFKWEKCNMDKRRVIGLPIKRTWDENDDMSFDTLEELSDRNCWDLIYKNILKNPKFIELLSSSSWEKFNVNKNK